MLDLLWRSAPLEEYEKLVFRMNTPGVEIDNDSSSTETLIKINSAKTQGILLQTVQVLTDLNLSIKKAYICSDGQWFLDVYHVTDINGEKLIDEGVISYLEQSLGSIHCGITSSFNGLTVLELTGTDRFGLLSDVSAVLAELQCDVVEAKVWTHNGRIASLIYVKDCNSGSPIEELQKIDTIIARLNLIQRVKTSVSLAVTHTERRLHQMMFADRDYEKKSSCDSNGDAFADEDHKRKSSFESNGELCAYRDYERKSSFDSNGDTLSVTIENWVRTGYSVVYVRCKDRMRLLFDVVCTLTDMEYVIFHATINTAEDKASLEFYIKHADGTPISSNLEQTHVIQCLEAAVQRRASEGVRLEFSAPDRPGLLAYVTRTFREHGLNISRAEVSTPGEKAMNVFYLTDTSRNSVDPKIIQSIRQTIGPNYLKVKELPMSVYHRAPEREEQADGGSGSAMLISIGSRVLYNLGLIKSC